jgi:outer membrane usher protein
VIESGTGVTLNYDTVGTFTGGQGRRHRVAGSASLFALGNLSSEWLAYAGATSSAVGHKHGDTPRFGLHIADVNTLRRYSLGDFITSGLAWTRPVHLEGVQINSDFSMRPDLVTFPLPSISGSAAVPSTVNVLADGNLVASSQIAPAPLRYRSSPWYRGRARFR